MIQKIRCLRDRWGICQTDIEKNAEVDAIIKIAGKNKKTYIMAIGAITNIALAIKMAPQIINSIEIIWLGGHSLLQKNNLEYNFEQDTEAVKTVFDSKVNLTVIPCDNVASNLVTSIYELEHYLKNKGELCEYLIERFYNDGYTGIQKRRVIWDISVIAYLINSEWYKSEKISCPLINEDTSYMPTCDRHKITIVNHLDANAIFSDLFMKLGSGKA